MTSNSIFLEIGQTSLKVLGTTQGFDLPLERLPNGRLTEACKSRISAALQPLLKSPSWQARPSVLCAISARGVSLRRLRLPATAPKDNLHSLLSLQMEKEFPLSPDELAWGYSELGNTNGPGSEREFLVAAVRREAVEEFSDLLSAQGATPIFTLAALARANLCSDQSGTYALLDVGHDQSELIRFEQGTPSIVRTLSVGAENLDGLAAACDGQGTGQKVYVTGGGQRNQQIALALAQHLPVGLVCEALEVAPGQGRSAAVLGLRRAAEKGNGRPALVLELKRSNGAARVQRPVPVKLVAIATLLLIGIGLVPYAEALLLRPFLAKKLQTIKSERARLPMIDHELNFLQFLKVNHPPYLDSLYVIAKAAPQGAKLDSISMNRRGNLSLKGSMRDVNQVSDFRSKLIESGLFASVTVEEQSPGQGQGQPKLNVRMTAQWKPLAARQNLAVGPSAEEIEKAKTRVRNQPGAMPGMPMGMPPMMMPGMGMPDGPITMGGGMPPGAMPGRRNSTRAPRPGGMPSSPGDMPMPMPGPNGPTAVPGSAGGPPQGTGATEAPPTPQ
ncbi:MAG: hypothetical protein C5B50_27460 [Verrucomicrobia bacterium]|nr:MAG: hypothetical protein C5B50_27460 [Verrucomicrobiota bacterium]